jgi:integrase/recombinase XerD
VGCVIKLQLAHLVSDKDRHGNVRYYVRVTGAKRKHRIKGEPGSREFLAAYSKALSTALAERSGEEVKGGKGSIDWLLAQYYAGRAFASLTPETQAARQALLAEFAGAHGEKPAAKLNRRAVKRIVDGWQAKGPHAARNRLKALRHVYAWALDNELVEADPTREVRAKVSRTSGYHTWTVEEIERFIGRWPIGTAPYVALSVLLNTGGRRADAYQLGPSNLQGDRIRFSPGKTEKTSGVVVDIPVVDMLRQALDVGPTGEETWIIGLRGRPFATAKSFGNTFKVWCVAAGLPHCSAHGLRKAGAALLAERGATPNQLLAIYGWTTLQQAELYTRGAERRRLADVLSTLSLRGKKPDDEEG